MIPEEEVALESFLEQWTLHDLLLFILSHPRPLKADKIRVLLLNKTFNLRHIQLLQVGDIPGNEQPIPLLLMLLLDLFHVDIGEELTVHIRAKGPPDPLEDVIMDVMVVLVV